MSKTLYAIEIEQSLSTSFMEDDPSLVEVWKIIPGYKNEYMVSSFGRIKSLKVRKGELKERIISLNTRKFYKLAVLTIDGKENYKPIHKLVAQNFIPNPKNKPYVNHIDGNKKNNKISNLEWVTASENNLHSFKMGRCRGNKKYTEEQIRKIHLIRRGNGFASYKYISAEMGIPIGTIGNVLRGNVWRKIYNEFNN